MSVTEATHRCEQRTRKGSGLELSDNDLFISSPQWRGADLAALFLLQILHFFVPPVRPRRFGYFSRTHFALMRKACQVTFAVKLYQRMLKYRQNKGLGN